VTGEALVALYDGVGGFRTFENQHHKKESESSSVHTPQTIPPYKLRKDNVPASL
jgi:hypothetical protein